MKPKQYNGREKKMSDQEEQILKDTAGNIREGLVNEIFIREWKMSKTIYQKGEIYVSDDSDGSSDVGHFPYGTYISCDDNEIYDYFEDDKVLQKSLPYGYTVEECVYMVKTVEITTNVRVQVYDQRN
jgi:hypothetical protein